MVNLLRGTAFLCSIESISWKSLKAETLFAWTNVICPILRHIEKKKTKRKIFIGILYRRNVCISCWKKLKWVDLLDFPFVIWFIVIVIVGLLFGLLWTHFSHLILGSPGGAVRQFFVKIFRKGRFLPSNVYSSKY